MGQIKVSVVIPVYNSAEFILRALDSIPDRDDIEVLITDDGSTDNSLELIKNYPRLNIKLVIHEKNMGISMAVNDASKLATGEYLYRLDPDDYLYTNEFNLAMEQLDGTDLVFVDAITNEDHRMRQKRTNKCCAEWFKFIRREFLGDYQREINIYGGDKELDDYILNLPHTEKQTELLVYHYNYPRKGSVSWILTH